MNLRAALETALGDGGVSPSTPEPKADIAAQIRALLDEEHPKRAVFVAAGNERAIPKNIPVAVSIVRRGEGVLLTRDQRLAVLVRSAAILRDSDLALILGYSETKASALASGAPIGVQARDRDGYVVTEMIASPQRLDDAVAALSRHGVVTVLSPLDMQRRRQRLIGEEEGNG